MLPAPSSPPTDPFLRTGFDQAAHVTGAVRLENVATRGVQWLWPGRIPIGKVTLLVGDPGLGKSLVALDIAARVSTGAAWPDETKAEGGGRKGEGKHTPVATEKGGTPGASSDGRGEKTPTTPFAEPQDVPPSPTSGPPPSALRPPPSSVLLLTAEDDLADTIRPRLEAAGADCSRIIAVPSILGSDPTSAVPRAHELQRDLARLRGLVNTLSDCRLIIVDPINAYLGGGENSSGEVRNLLVPLAQLAQERQLAVVAVSHLRKKEGAAIYRMMGSLTFVTAARAAWVICPDPANTDPDQPARRLMLPIKSNLAARAAGLAYTIESKAPPRTQSTAQPESYVSPEIVSPETHLSPENDAPPVVRWSTEPIKTSADDGLRGRARSAGRPSNEREEGARWLEKTLAAGLRATSEIEDEAIANGFRLHTLRRAFRDLGGEAFRLGGVGPLGHWFWKLPD